MEKVHHYYGRECAVWISITISTKEARHQYGRGCAVRRRGAVQNSQTISTEERLCSTDQ